MAKGKIKSIILAACACLVLASACTLSACSSAGNCLQRFIQAVDNTIAYSRSYAIHAAEDLGYTSASIVRTDTVSMAVSYSRKTGEIAYLYDDSDVYTDPTGEHDPVTFAEASEYYKLLENGTYTAYSYDGTARVCTAEDDAYLTMMDKAQKLSAMRPITDTSNLYLEKDLLYYMLMNNGGPGIGHRLSEYTLDVSKAGGTTAYTVSYSGVDEGTGETDDVSVSYRISGRRIAGYTITEESAWTEDGEECTLSYSLSYEFSYEYDAGLAVAADLEGYEYMD